jgi:hypothetical protein
LRSADFRLEKLEKAACRLCVYNGDLQRRETNY